MSLLMLLQRARGRYRLILLVIISIGIVVALVIQVGSSKPENTDSFYARELGAIKTSSEEIVKLNQDTNQITEADIDTYESNLVSSLGNCRKIEGYKPEQLSKPQEDVVTQTKQFCGDYVRVVDYARLLSKSTKQFIRFPASTLQTGSEQNVSQLQEILGYTLTDLTKLKSNPINDPAVQEYITNLESLQKQSTAKPQDPAALAEATARQQKNILTGRYYFWNTTVQMNALQKSVDKLIASFKATG